MTDSPAPWSCNDVLSHIYEFIDGELGATADECVRAHVAACAYCGGAFDSEKTFLRLIRQRACIEPCPEELRVRIIEALIDRGARDA